MLAAIAAVLIVLWLLGFLAFHASSGLIRVRLVIGIVGTDPAFPTRQSKHASSRRIGAALRPCLFGYCPIFDRRRIPDSVP
jgi:hypothetical protein